jgi:microcystin-dependent protein
MPSVSLLHNSIGDVNQGGQLVPTGTVFAFAGTTAPSGWLLCDGTAYSQTTYAALFSVLASTYNTQINPTTNAAWASPTAGTFRVPDYRGVFLRSYGQASGQANNSVGTYQSQSTAKNGLSIADNTMTHTHDPFRRDYAFEGVDSRAGTAAGRSSSSYTADSIQSATQTHGHSMSGDSETRPFNKSVMYIIKV